MSRAFSWPLLVTSVLAVTGAVSSAGALSGLPLVGAEPVLAQDAGTTVVPKSSRPSGTAVTGTLPQSDGATEGLKPSQDAAPQQAETPPPIAPDQAPPPAPVEAAAPSGELDGDTSDEGAGWEAAVEPSGPTPLVGEERDEAVEKINAYFNEMDSLQGTFRQVDGENKVATGRFYVKRPGKLRFDYEPPSPLRVVSDGHFLAIEDSSLKTVEKYPIESTPFRLLLANNVNVMRDSTVLGVARGEDQLSIKLQDKKGGTGGTITLVFTLGQEIQLNQWIITDAQGLTTTVTLDQLSPGRKVASDFFQSKQSFNPFQ